MKSTLTLLTALLLAPLAAICAAEPPAKQPNVVLFLVDDMGWMDCGAYGSRYYKTPHMDAFAKQAMRFTDAYAMPLCSPTRASILSGQYTSRHGVTSAVGHTPPVKAVLQAQAAPNAPLLMPESGSYLDPAQYTLAEALRDAGYRTAHIGKWHLGLTEPHWPEAHGFDVTFHCHPDPGPPGGYFSPYGVLPPGSERPKGKNAKYVVGNISDGPDGEYIVDRQAAEAEKFIDANKDRPFFLNLWCYGVHGPWGHKHEYTEEFAKTTDPRGTQGNPIMASMLRSVDECFGRILAKLDALDLAENTIVIFTSDNGGNVHSNSGEDAKAQKRKADDPMLVDWRKWAGDQPPTNNSPLRSGKGRLYEGGTRVPLMVRWPGKIAPAATSDAVVGCYDIYPTVLDLAGIPFPPQQKIDGVSYAPVLRGTGTLQRDAYFIWFPHLVPGVSVRQGDWKLIRRFTERPGDYEGVHELFNLKDDLGESKNLASQMPEKVKSLNALIDDFVRDSGALYPQPNPAYKPKDRLAVNIANWDAGQFATDWVEFDIAFSPNTPQRHPYYSTLEGNNSKPFGPLFKAGTAVDQFGRDQITGPGIADSKSVWEHRIIGLSSTAPGPLGKHGVVFTGGKAGTFTVYLDNLRIRHLDGSTTPLWTSGKDTRDNVAPYFMVTTMVQQLEKVKARYSFYPVEGVAHRLQAILDTEFDGKAVNAHTLDFCFEVMKLGELIKQE